MPKRLAASSLAGWCGASGLGRMVNNNFAEYHVPVHADIPAVEVLWMDEVDTHVNALGMKGIGEIGICGVGGGDRQCGVSCYGEAGAGLSDHLGQGVVRWRDRPKHKKNRLRLQPM